ncbi:hypothetical protein ACSSS7_004621 [Eimeria intestinalis]
MEDTVKKECSMGYSGSGRVCLAKGLGFRVSPDRMRPSVRCRFARCVVAAAATEGGSSEKAMQRGDRVAAATEVESAADDRRD